MKTFLICIALATVALAKPLGETTEAVPTTLAAAKTEEKLSEATKPEATIPENKDAAAPNTTPVEKVENIPNPTFEPPRPILPIEVKKEDLKEAVKEAAKPETSEATTLAAAGAEEKKSESKVDIVEAANVPAGVADDVVDPVAIISTPEKKIDLPAKEESEKAKETSTGATPVDDALRVKTDNEKITEQPKTEEKKSEAVVAEPKPEESAKTVETTPIAEKQEEKRSTELSSSAESTTNKSSETAEKNKDSSSEKDNSSSSESSEESTEKKTN